MRGVQKETLYKGESHFATMAMALIIAFIIAFAAMFFSLQRQAPSPAGIDYYLPWVLPYGIVNLLFAGFGVYATTVRKEKPKLYFPGFIIGIVGGTILLGEAIPLIAPLNNIEFFISLLAIGICVIVISALGIATLKEKR